MIVIGVLCRPVDCLFPFEASMMAFGIMKASSQKWRIHLSSMSDVSVPWL